MKYQKEISAGGIVFKKNGENIEWLLIQNSSHKGWGFPKGHVGDKVRNEPIDVAALREVREEGGIETHIVNKEPIVINYKYRYQNYLIDKTVYYFLMEYQAGSVHEHDWEISEAKFTTAEEVLKTVTYHNDKEAFEKALLLIK